MLQEMARLHVNFELFNNAPPSGSVFNRNQHRSKAGQSQPGIGGLGKDHLREHIWYSR
jgi:hypothetical protein